MRATIRPAQIRIIDIVHFARAREDSCAQVRHKVIAAHVFGAIPQKVAAVTCPDRNGFFRLQLPREPQRPHDEKRIPEVRRAGVPATRRRDVPSQRHRAKDIGNQMITDRGRDAGAMC